MHAVTIKEAKARLNALVEAARRGEQVVLMRGSEHVALLVPISSDDLEVAPRLTDAQASRLWKQIADERAAGTAVEVGSAPEAVADLSRKPRAPRRIASLGMPKTTHVLSSWAMVRAPRRRISSRPSAPSAPIPVSSTPTACRPAHSAKDRNSTSTEGL